MHEFTVLGSISCTHSYQIIEKLHVEISFVLIFFCFGGGARPIFFSYNWAAPFISIYIEYSVQ